MSSRVLICDNEEPLRALVRAALSLRGYELLEARDGEEALELARQARPDVIVLDVMMPVRTGLEVLREVRADPDLSGTPVVMLTARTQLEDQEAAIDAGADRFLPKPFSPLELDAVVVSLLEGAP